MMVVFGRQRTTRC